jgi:polysaccharide biosynthesis protein PslH
MQHPTPIASATVSKRCGVSGRRLVMRLLWVKGGKLLPVDTGGKIRSYNILKGLARRHEVVLLSYYPGTPDPEYDAAIVREFPGAVTVALGEIGGAVGQALHYARRFFDTAPYSVTKFTDPAVRARVEEFLADPRIDVAVADFLLVTRNFPAQSSKPTVLFQHNVESTLWRRNATYEGNPLRKTLFATEAAKMYRYERAALSHFDGIVAVSEHDRSLMLAMGPRAPITVVRTGVDVAGFAPSTATGRGTRTVMFLGSMDWPANVDGVEYFCERIWPQIVAAVPDVRFQVVGRNPPPRITRFVSDSVEIVGGVKSVLSYLHRAAVFVVPLRIGGGTRLKIYEAMAAAVPVVSTTVGAEGLDVHDGTDIVLADDAEHFGQSVIELLRTPEKRTSLATAASVNVARFDWSVIAADFERVLERAILASQPSSV